MSASRLRAILIVSHLIITAIHLDKIVFPKFSGKKSKARDDNYQTR